MKLKHLVPVALALAALASCTSKSNIRGEIKDYPEGEIVVARLGVGSFSKVDTIKTGKDAKFCYNVEVEKGKPAFVYIYKGDTKLASLLVEKGEKIVVEADTLGNFSVEGSEGSALMSQVEKDYAEFGKKMASTEDGKELASIYIDYYRSRLRYIMEHPYSLSVIPVLYQSLNNLSVFGQYTDALHFRSACDSLKTVYPESEYVLSLEKEAQKREQLLGLSTSISAAPAISYPELEMPDINGNKVKLSEVDAKVVLLHFWSADDAAQSVMNIEVLQSVYERYRNRGFEIYSVCVSIDKAKWAGIVKAQDLQWINVNDGLGVNSPALLTYNVAGLPTAFILADGDELVEPVKDAESLSRQLDKLL